MTDLNMLLLCFREKMSAAEAPTRLGKGRVRESARSVEHREKFVRPARTIANLDMKLLGVHGSGGSTLASKLCFLNFL